MSEIPPWVEEVFASFDDDKPRDNGAKTNGNGQQQAKGSDTTIGFINIADDPIPPREWAVHDRIPMRNVTLVSGEGAIGKSILLLQLSAAMVLGRDWISTLPKQGPVIYLSCEDDDDEIRRRVEAIAAHYQTTRKELAADLHVLSLVGRDPILGFPDRSDRIQKTGLFDQVRKSALTIKPHLIVIDTVADVFAGRENDRSQTRQFITLLRGLAIEADAAVILASHPSLTGISTDTGLSGNTAWHNSVRARAYFKKAPGNNEDLRVLEWRKNNYGPISENILLRWRNGVYQPEPRPGSLEQLAAEAKIDQIFSDLLPRFTKRGLNVSAKPNAPTYAPAEFAKEKEAKEAKLTRADFEAAMRRLLSAGKIKVENYGPPSRGWTKLVVA